MQPIHGHLFVTRVPVVLSNRAFDDLQELRLQFDDSPAIRALNEAIKVGFPVPAVGPTGARMEGETVRQRRDRSFEWDVYHPDLLIPDAELSDDDLLADPLRPLGIRLLGFYQIHSSTEKTTQERFLLLATSELLRKYRGYDPADL